MAAISYCLVIFTHNNTALLKFVFSQFCICMLTIIMDFKLSETNHGSKCHIYIYMITVLFL